ncbi:GNAT family N-acetyltransferase [Catellatospora tritici]|uniref:GNAT family N-acetyltransferase n=1 Tax=Catellatospora tritici TaxID=2851566 RepID=UPI001C2DCAC3|nr:GNAT family N-acetyltransferase [Catellatospora tritici]MBV1853802.1 GNAT family N-acetyltransferase [Catellatospora tritici]
MRIRRATAADAEALAAVHVRTWQDTYRGQVPQAYLAGLDPAERVPGWRGWIAEDEAPLGTTVLDHPTGGVIGFVNASASAADAHDPLLVGEVTALYVLPAYQGIGGGRALLADGLDRLFAAGCRHAVLWVLASNERARRYYEAGNWSADGAHRVDHSRGFPCPEVRYRYTLVAPGPPE